MEFPKFKTKESRLESLKEYPKDYPSREKLAEAGFFYSGNGVSDDCQCYHCGTKLIRWSPNDDPVEEHRVFRADCPLLNYKSAIPTTANPNSEVNNTMNAARATNSNTNPNLSQFNHASTSKYSPQPGTILTPIPKDDLYSTKNGAANLSGRPRALSKNALYAPNESSKQETPNNQQPSTPEPSNQIPNSLAMDTTPPISNYQSTNTNPPIQNYQSLNTNPPIQNYQSLNTNPPIQNFQSMNTNPEFNYQSTHTSLELPNYQTKDTNPGFPNYQSVQTDPTPANPIQVNSRPAAKINYHQKADFNMPSNNPTGSVSTQSNYSLRPQMLASQYSNLYYPDYSSLPNSAAQNHFPPGGEYPLPNPPISSRIEENQQYQMPLQPHYENRVSHPERIGPRTEDKQLRIIPNTSFSHPNYQTHSQIGEYQHYPHYSSATSNYVMNPQSYQKDAFHIRPEGFSGQNAPYNGNEIMPKY